MNDRGTQSTHIVQKTIHPKAKDLGAFTAKRSLPQPDLQTVGPFIFFDEMGPAHLSDTENVDVRPHPHINLSTITYLFEGNIHHRDSLGCSQIIVPGEVNLMVAGRGIVHSERTPGHLRNTSKALHGLQLWIALPEAHEEVDPAFYHYPTEDIPEWTEKDTKYKLVMGSFGEHISPVQTYSPTLYLVGESQAGATLALPQARERALYVVKGSVDIDNTTYNSGTMLLLKDQPSMSISCPNSACTWALIGGEPIGPRHLYWNFVSSRPERIEQAKVQWEQDDFPKIPDDQAERIPLPT